jgi:hypothetical protein
MGDLQQRKGLVVVEAKGLVQEAVEIATDQDYRSLFRRLQRSVVLVVMSCVPAAQRPRAVVGGKGPGAGGTGNRDRPGLQVRGCRAMGCCYSGVAIDSACKSSATT